MFLGMYFEDQMKRQLNVIKHNIQEDPDEGGLMIISKSILTIDSNRQTGFTVNFLEQKITNDDHDDDDWYNWVTHSRQRKCEFDREREREREREMSLELSESARWSLLLRCSVSLARCSVHAATYLSLRWTLSQRQLCRSFSRRHHRTPSAALSPDGRRRRKWLGGVCDWSPPAATQGGPDAAAGMHAIDRRFAAAAGPACPRRRHGCGLPGRTASGVESRRTNGCCPRRQRRRGNVPQDDVDEISTSVTARISVVVAGRAKPMARIAIL